MEQNQDLLMNPAQKLHRRVNLLVVEKALPDWLIKVRQFSRLDVAIIARSEIEKQMRG